MKAASEALCAGAAMAKGERAMTTPTATPAQLVTLRDRISRILIGESCGRIGFRIGGAHIRPGGFTVIGMSIATATASRRGHGDRRSMGVAVRQMPDGVGAEYNTPSNTIRVPSADYGRTLDDRNGIVHEATHAIYDYFRIRATALEEEAGAYIAGAMYTRMEGGDHSAISSPIFRIAWEISADLVAPHRLMRPWTDAVSPAQQQRLVNAIAASPTYSYFRRHRTERYTHDGGRI